MLAQEGFFDLSHCFVDFGLQLSSQQHFRDKVERQAILQLPVSWRNSLMRQFSGHRAEVRSGTDRLGTEQLGLASCQCLLCCPRCFDNYPIEGADIIRFL